MKKPIRILHVVTSMNAGGIESMLMNLYRVIDREKVQFDFLVHTDAESFFEKEIVELGGEIHRIPPLRLTNLSKYKNSLNEFFKREDYQYVHSHYTFISYFILKAAEKNNVKIRIAHSHEAVKSIWDRGVVKVPFIFALKQVINNPVTHRFACGQAAGEWMFEKAPFTVLHNAIDVKRFLYDKTIAAKAKEKLGLENKIIFGNIGRFSRQKNHGFLIEIFEGLQKEIKNAHLLLIGDGELRAGIENLVKEKNLEKSVSFLGVRKDIVALLHAMDYMLMPSLYEGLSVTMVEAQANGLKIFASDKIATETDFTNLIDFISIADRNLWVDHIVNNLSYERKNTYDKLVEANYDIEANAKFVENFYLDLMKDE